MSKYALVIEHEACWGCKTCEVACNQEHDFKKKFMYVVEERPTPGGATEAYRYRVNVCRHCDDPACVPACPEEAITRRDDGIVILDPDRCSGCRNCLEACEYDGIWFDEENEKAVKCNMCHHRVDQGLLPACADNFCLAHCIYFGDPVAIGAEIQAKRRKRKTK